VPDPPIADTLAASPDSLLTSGGAPASSGPAVVGERYEILGLLGSGGMGNVYRALDRELSEVVALKVLRPELVDAPDAVERFRREVKLARRITHPNVARVFDIGERGGAKIFTMELIDGEPLSATLAREGRLAPARAVEVASAICAGLGAAHAAGVIHRDLKADNVLVERGGRVVLGDFGIARALVADDAAVTGGFVGTPAYMAPEQIEGGAVDERTDVYALGCLLYEMLTGARPWPGDNVFAVAAARLLHPPPDPLAQRPELPASLGAVVTRCLARQPADRFASVTEVAAALGALAEGAAPLGAVITPAPSGAPRAHRPAEAQPRAQTSVAVLPFRNAGPPEQDYVADGLTEDVIDLLSMSAGLRVCSRGMVMRWKGVERDPREIGRELAVQIVVEGAVRRTTGGVRISARLISVTDGVQLWARRFDRPDAELLGVSDDAARAVAEALTAEIGGPARRSEAAPEAMDFYLRARAAYHHFFDDPTGVGYLELFERAVALAPDNPRILAGYAMARARAWAASPAARRAAEEAAASAAASAPDLPETQLALATVRYERGEAATAVTALRRAIALQPGNGDAHELLGRILAETPRAEDARRHLLAALALEPGHVLGRLALARLHELGGRPDEADRLCAERPEATRPGLGRLLMWRRDARGAAELLTHLDGSDAPTRVTRLFLAPMTGAAADYYLLEALTDPARSTTRARIFFLQLVAEVAAASGDAARALDAVERAAEAPCFDVVWADGCPLFEGLRGEPRFVAARALIAARAEKVAEAYAAAG
jgi:serine/threonine-protein kinase